VVQHNKNKVSKNIPFDCIEFGILDFTDALNMCISLRFV